MPKIIDQAADELLKHVAKKNENSNNQILWNLGIRLVVMYMLFAILKGVFLFFTRQTIIVMSRNIEFDLKNEIFSKYQQLENQMGQKCWVKVTYNAPTAPNLNILKNKCSCNSSNSTIDFQENGFIIFPNPVVDFLNISDDLNIKNQNYYILNINGEIIKNGTVNNGKIFLADLERGIYFLKYSQKVIKISKI